MENNNMKMEVEEIFSNNDASSYIKNNNNINLNDPLENFSHKDTSSYIKNKNNINWNEPLENAAKYIGESSKGYKLMHLRLAQTSRKIYNRLMFLGILIGPLGGMVSAIEAFINPSVEPISAIIAISFGFLSGIIVAIIKFGKYDEVSNANKQAAARYTSIESNVRRQLGLYRNDRFLAIPYMEWLETKFEEIFLSAPLLPEKSYDNYYIFAKKMGLIIPNHYEGVIHINTEYTDTKINEIKNISSIEVNQLSVIDRIRKIDNKEEQETTTKNISERKSSSSNSDKELSGEKCIKRTNDFTEFPMLNHCSDKMLEYEIKRMFNFT